ncbi:molybdate ABC transporter substrate-binding protein [Actinomyces oris]|uniref:molybdate ABC transporter substrate-binding protein n=1 Tax=Actinomyces oris TaxID=544580 RepID=UPI00094DDD0B|nr:molybdate ABC transporter substrate-binding protein [Actinomyces oris]OLO65787.1 molybdate ABC transporter substrate-binding protein [Actinomyces oris]
MNITRRAAIAAISMLSALSLAACGGSASNGSTGAASDAASASASAGAEKATGELKVLAAASLKASFTEIGTQLEKDNPGLHVTFDFQGSQTLVSSLSEGNEADVLATADEPTMNKAVEQKLVGERTEFATNVPTLIVPKGNPANVKGIDSSLDNAKLVICVETAPCGNAAKELAKAYNVTLNPVSEEQKVTDVRTKVESGEADAGVVYKTDAVAAKDKVDEITIDNKGVVNHYPIAQTAKPSNPEAAQVFINAITSKSGQEILAKYGFGKPGDATSASAGASPSAGGAATASTAASATPSQAATAGGSSTPEADKPTVETTAP